LFIVGFDFFDTDRNILFSRKQDQTVLDEHDPHSSSRETILKNLLASGIQNVELVGGNVVETTKAYAEANLGFRISLLYLDVDNYEGTLAVLKNLYPLVSPGGLVVFDEYAYRSYGESDAVSEYFKGSPIALKSLSWANTPTAFLIKDSV
jgi:predicted O-methyltransferase YrrM